MSMARAIAIGRRRRRRGQLWPMPVRETDWGHIFAEITVRPMAGSGKSWTGMALVDTGATDTFLPSSVLRKLGIKRVGRRSYELADGRDQILPIGLAAIEIMGQIAGGTVVFACDDEEPLLGVTVLESAGFLVDPREQRLVVRIPRRK